MTFWSFWSRSPRSNSSNRKARTPRRASQHKPSSIPSAADRQQLHSLYAPNLELLEERHLLAANVFQVTVAEDIDDGETDLAIATQNGLSLREAVRFANTTANDPSGMDQITFALGDGSDPLEGFVIELNSTLSVTDQVYIMGFSQLGSQGNTLTVGSDAEYRIEIQAGAGLPNATGTPLLEFRGAGASNSVLEGLVINSLNGEQDAILLNNTSGVHIQGNYIGVDVTGMNATEMGRNGIRIEGGGGHVIGGSSPAERNVISGNYLSSPSGTVDRGMIVVGLATGSANNRFENNYLGTDKTGNEQTVTSTNNSGTMRQAGVIITNDNSDNNTILGNVISAQAFGIRLKTAGINGTQIVDNSIGVGADGETNLDLVGTSTTTAIYMDNRGSVTIRGNLIGNANNPSLSNNSGIRIAGGSASLLIENNKIFNNRNNGILFAGGVGHSNVTVRGNTITGNEGGIYLESNSLSNINITNNVITDNNLLNFRLNPNITTGVTFSNNTSEDTGDWAQLLGAFIDDNFRVYVSFYIDPLLTSTITSFALFANGVEIDTINASDYAQGGAFTVDLGEYGDEIADGVFLVENLNFSGAATDSNGNTSNLGGDVVLRRVKLDGSNLPATVDGGALIVTSTAVDDVSVKGSLHWAVNVANNFAGVQGIFFAIDSVTLTISKGMDITDQIYIDGYSALSSNVNGQGIGSDAQLGVEIVRSGAGSSFIFRLNGAASSGSVIRGLSLNTQVTTTDAAAIVITGSSSNVIAGNFFNLGFDGETLRDTTAHGILISNSASANTIGGDANADTNVFGGNYSVSDRASIKILGAANVIAGNLLGVDRSGNSSRIYSAANNSLYGVLVSGSAALGNTIGGTGAHSMNVISGYSRDGVRITAGASGNLIAGNRIGVNAYGNADIGNAYNGISISTSNNTVGGNSSEYRNIISGNNSYGVWLFDGASNNVVAGNYIGTDVSGTTKIANHHGVVLGQSGGRVAGNTIGGSVEGAHNVISGNNQHGVYITNNASENVVAGNWVGIDATGADSLKNGDGTNSQVVLDGSSQNGNTIGGPSSEYGNFIGGATSTADGIAIVSGNNQQILWNSLGVLPGTGAASNVGRSGVSVRAGTGNTVRFNQIINTGSVAVSVYGATGNDAGDGDSGTNRLQNYPVISSAMVDENGDVIVVYSIDSDIANSTYPIAIDIYRAFGGGTAALLTTVMATEPGEFTVNLGSVQDNPLLTLGAGIVAMATDAEGNTSAVSGTVYLTSAEFKNVYVVTNNSTSSTVSGSLAWVAERANSSIGYDLVAFDISSGSTTISSGSIVAFTDKVYINGYSQWGANENTLVDGSDAVLRIEVVRTASGSTFHINTAGANDSTIRGLLFRNTATSGSDTAALKLENVTGVTVAGNFFNTDLLGMTSTQTQTLGLSLKNADYTMVGGTNPADRNVFGGDYTGTTASDVSMVGVYNGSDHNQIVGNRVGLAADGSELIHVGSGSSVYVFGIYVRTSDYDNVIRDNMVSTDKSIAIRVASSGTLIAGNTVGLAADGSALSIKNNYGISLVGSGYQTTIGGSTATDRNYLAGVGATATAVINVDSTGNVIRGNYVGTDITGTVGTGGLGRGIYVSKADNTIGGTGTGDGNVVGGNGATAGIYLYSEAARTYIAGNSIGIGADGVTAVGNNAGIRFDSNDNTIGGSVAGARNVVSGNSYEGIYGYGSLSGNWIAGNFVGVGADGVTSVGNGGIGIVLRSPTGSSYLTANTIGALGEYGRNVIAANGANGLMFHRNSSANLIINNWIGVGNDGSTVTGNGSVGNSSLLLYDGVAIDNTVGGATAEYGNVIVGINGESGNHGVYIQGNNNLIASNTIGIAPDGSPHGLTGDGVNILSGSGNRILSNSIAYNGGDGIDFGSTAGVTTRPTISSAIILSTGELRIQFDAPASWQYGSEGLELQFFESIGDQGKTLFYEYTVNAAGEVELLIEDPSALGLSAGDTIVMTATDSEGDTSQFSIATTIINAWPDLPADVETVYVVTNTAGDARVGSLRWAVQQANNNIGYDAILFSIDPSLLSASGTYQINTPDLINITDRLYIDGYSQAEASINTASDGSSNANIVIEVRRNKLDDSSVFRFQDITGSSASGSTIRGFSLTTEGNAVTAAGIRVENTSGIVIAGNYFGLALDGTEVRQTNGNGVSILANASHVTVGGTTAADMNVFGGEVLVADRAFVYVLGSDNVIAGNIIGLDAKGLSTGSTGSMLSGIVLSGSSAARNTIGGTADGARNVISGNPRMGIHFKGASSANLIQGNYIGTDITGNAAAANSSVGIQIDGDNAHDTTIGGSTAAARNVITGNAARGILVWGGISGTVIAGNYIGATADGQSALGNGSPSFNNISISNENFRNATIGGPTAEWGNVIVGAQQSGVYLLGRDSLIAYNSIGILPDGSNGGNIADGVRISGATSTGNSILFNSFAYNGESGIDIGDGNDGQAAPTLSYAYLDGGGDLYVVYTTTEDDLTLQFFEGLGGQGYSYLGQEVRGTAGTYTFKLAGAADLGLAAGETLVGTATDANGNTSNFSVSISVLSTPTDLPDEIVNVFVVTNTNASGTGSLTSAVAAAASSPGFDAILFNIAGSGPHTIENNTILVVGSQVFIDGYSQQGSKVNTLDAGSNAEVNIVLKRTGTGSTFQITAGGSNSTVRGMVFQNNSNVSADYSGLKITDATGVVISGNYFNTDATGMAAVAASGAGLSFDGGDYNTIGGLSVGDRNIFGGNYSGAPSTTSGAALVLVYDGAHDNVVLNNLIGVGQDGVTSIVTSGPKPVYGVRVASDSGSANLIEGNVIASAGSTALRIESKGTTAVGNLIGVRADGTGLVSAANSIGIEVLGADNTLGATGNGNVVAGASFANIRLQATGNRVQSNLIGTDVFGTTALAGTGDGIVVTTSGITIGGVTAGQGNVIGGSDDGIVLLGTASNNRIVGNFIGVGSDGVTNLGNTGDGIVVGSAGNTIGGFLSGAGNTISANGGNGISIRRDSTTTFGDNNLVVGNFVGVGSGTIAGLGNSGDGILIEGAGNTIGGTVEGSGNVIAGSGGNGVHITFGASASVGGSNLVAGNIIGAGSDGVTALGNAGQGIVLSGTLSDAMVGNTIGAAGEFGRNIVVGSGSGGIRLEYASANLVINNYIGVAADGTTVIRNSSTASDAAVTLSQSNANSIGALVGGTQLGNVVVGTASYNSDGISIEGTDNRIEFNSIGVLPNGAAAGMQQWGVNISGATSSGNTILSNSIANNGAGGITLNGVANDNLSTPVVLAAYFDANSDLYINFQAAADWDYTNGPIYVQFFRSLSDQGQGIELVGTMSVAAAGSYTLRVENAAQYGVDDSADIVGTATDTEGNTSTFSNFEAVVALDFDLPDDIQSFFVVVNTNDSGTGSLRWAISSANANADYTAILFNLDADNPSNVQTAEHTFLIQVTGSVLDVTSRVYIDGYTQTGASENTFTDGSSNANIKVEVRRTAYNTFRFFTGSDDSVIRGLAITTAGGVGESDAGIKVENAKRVQIAGNFFGLAGDGTTVRTVTSNNIAILSNASNVTIGGTSPGDMNVFGGDFQTADRSHILINGSGNVVAGNLIGTDKTGTVSASSTSAVPSSGTTTIVGVRLSGSGARDNTIGGTIGGTATGARNVISGNDSDGIYVVSSGTGNVVAGNYIGTDYTGMHAVGNRRNGITINNSSGNTIGGSGPLARNVISGNSVGAGESVGAGVLFIGSSSNNVIAGNYIGTDKEGEGAGPSGFDLGNRFGINIYSSVSGANIIGGAISLGEGNVIAGNTERGFWSKFSISGMTLAGNYIGINAGGDTVIGNGTISGTSGVVIQGAAAAGNTIGGDSADYGNFVAGALGNGFSLVGNQYVVQYNTIGILPDGTDAGNNKHGVYIVSGSGNTIRFNSMANNGEQGIALEAGSNNGIAAPTLASVAYINDLGQLVIQFEIDTAADWVDFYLSDGGQGRTWISAAADLEAGIHTVVMDPPASGEVDFAAGLKFVATTTDADGNTSAFSAETTIEEIDRPVGIQNIYFVTNTADSGDGSLRWAIEAANNSVGTYDMVYFAISDDQLDPQGWFVINTNSPLEITDQIYIDGYSQAGASVNDANDGSSDAVLMVEVIGGATGSNSTFAFTGASDESVLRGLAISTLGNTGSAAAISIDGVDQVHVAGNFIGLAADGTTVRTMGGSGIFIANSSGNTIGGLTVADRNVFGGNFVSGDAKSRAHLWIQGSANRIEGNLIGTDRTGTISATSGGSSQTVYGLMVTGNASFGNTIGGSTEAARNVISGNKTDGLHLYNTGETLVAGNFIGTDRTGENSLGNGRTGILVTASDHNTIGGYDAGYRNVISGNSSVGIRLYNSANNLVIGNFVGTNADGDGAIGNSLGIDISSGRDNVIGGSQEGARNVISGNKARAMYVYDQSTGNLIAGNYMGVSADGQVALGNGPVSGSSNGIVINNTSAVQNTIGGADAASGNYIVGAGANGIYITGQRTTVWNNTIGILPNGTAAGSAVDGVYVNSGTGNSIRFNSIANNNGLGINLNGTGANNGMASPVMAAYAYYTADGDLAIQITVSGGSGEVDFYLSDGGQGRTWVGNLSVPSSGTYTYVIDDPSSLGIDLSTELVTTFTDSLGNTSEFSAASVVKEINIPVGVAHVFLVTNTNSSGEGSLAWAINAANTTAGYDMVAFAISGTGPQIVNVAGTLSVTERLYIDGFSQLGSPVDESALGNEETFQIVVRMGTSLKASIISLDAGSSGSTVRGLVMQSMSTSGSTSPAMGMIYVSSDGNVIEANRFGTTADGTTGEGNNNLSAVHLQSTSNNTISGNLIGHLGANAAYSGIRLLSASNNLIVGNYLGTNGMGSATLGLKGSGIYAETNSNYNTIGGLSAATGALVGDGNLIATLYSGIQLNGSHRNTVIGNRIGVNAQGDAVLGQGDGGNRHGINITEANNNTIGGLGDAANIVAGLNKGPAVQISGSYNQIVGNYLGVNPNDLSDTNWGNTGYGVSIGGTVTGNSILHNAIANNSSGGIQIASGANQNQPAPVISAVEFDENNGTVAVSLSVASGGTGTLVQFFLSQSGQGLVYLGEGQINANGGTETIVFVTPISLDSSDQIVAIATNPDGSSSKFSGEVEANTLPTITGVTDETIISDDEVATPFANVVIDEPDGQTVTVLITATDGLEHGALDYEVGYTGPKFGWDAVLEKYVFSGSAADATTAINALIFTPAPDTVLPGQSVITQFTIDVTDSSGGNAFNSDTTVVVGSENNVPEISGVETNATLIGDSGELALFAGVEIHDPDYQASLQVAITLDQMANGSLGYSESYSGPKFVWNETTLQYEYSGSPADATTAIQNLIFTPTENQVTPGQTVRTQFTIAVSDGIANTVFNSDRVVDALSINDAPVIDGISTGVQEILDNESTSPFANVTVRDPDVGQQISVELTLTGGTHGSLSGGGFAETYAGSGTYLFVGSAAEAELALRALVYVPIENEVPAGQTVSTAFTLYITDGIDNASDATTVETYSFNDSPEMIGVPGSTITYPASSGWVRLMQGNDVRVTDPDVEPFAGGRLVISYAGASTTADNLVMQFEGTSLRLQVGQLFSGNTLIGSVLSGGNAGSSLIVEFNSAATNEHVSALLNSIGYVNTTPTFAQSFTRNLSITLTDAGGTAFGAVDHTSAGVSLAMPATPVPPPLVPLPDGPLPQLDMTQGGGPGLNNSVPSVRNFQHLDPVGSQPIASTNILTGFGPSQREMMLNQFLGDSNPTEVRIDRLFTNGWTNFNSFQVATQTLLQQELFRGGMSDGNRQLVVDRIARVVTDGIFDNLTDGEIAARVMSDFGDLQKRLSISMKLDQSAVDEFIRQARRIYQEQMGHRGGRADQSAPRRGRADQSVPRPGRADQSVPRPGRAEVLPASENQDKEVGLPAPAKASTESATTDSRTLTSNWLYQEGSAEQALDSLFSSVVDVDLRLPVHPSEAEMSEIASDSIEAFAEPSASESATAASLGVAGMVTLSQQDKDKKNTPATMFDRVRRLFGKTE